MVAKSAPARILVVDDDPAERLSLSRMISALGYLVETAEHGEEALEKLGSISVDAIVTDLIMPQMDGFGLLRALLERGDLTPAIVLTGFGSIDKAISIVHDLHAFWFLEKPAPSAALASLLERAIRYKALLGETARLQRQLSQHGVLGDLVGTSPAMRHVFAMVEQVAPSSAPVLITGESGTGKERVAAAIHRFSSRASGPFVAVNCAALPENLIESELFGHERGAFTGAVGRREGCFEMAHRGTLFLDEIGDMPFAMQAKLLRVLEDSRVRRLGGKMEIAVDVRVLAATNRPVQEALEKKLLREDLFYRLNVFHIDLPPLRHRKEDIPALAQSLIKRILNREAKRLSRRIYIPKCWRASSANSGPETSESCAIFWSVPSSWRAKAPLFSPRTFHRLLMSPSGTAVRAGQRRYAPRADRGSRKAAARYRNGIHPPDAPADQKQQTPRRGTAGNEHPNPPQPPVRKRRSVSRSRSGSS